MNHSDPRQASAALSKKLLFRMQRIRCVEESIAKRYCEWNMRCPTHLSIGQEAVGSAVGMLLRKDDFAVSTHRAHAHYLGKGGDLKQLIAELYGKATGCSQGKGGSMHLIDISVGFMGSTAIVGGTIPVGVGLGLSISLHKSDQISCVFFGDGAVEEGVFFESVNFAIVRKLPVLFICENNLYSVYSPLYVRQPAGRKIYKMAQSLGLPSQHGDGNNILEAHEKVQTAVQEIRQGTGPQFIEFATYRWREHCGPNYDNDLGYRTEDEFQAWKQLDPIKRLREKMLEDGLIHTHEIRQMERSIHEEVASAFQYAEESPFPASSDALTSIYRQMS